jgi:polyphosphate kinase 2
MGKKSKHSKKSKHPADQPAVEAAPKKKLSTKEYEKELYHLQAELCKLQKWVVEKGLRVIVVFEGRDAAGKGGVIKRLAERTSPRIFRVNALPSPSNREKTQLYLQRYIARFPAAGEIAIFDRSWYNRAGVEKVMGFCTDEQYERFLRTIPQFEKTITNDGIILIKYWFEVSKEVQTKRFEARMSDPRKHWKLSPMDLESHKRWYDYSRAKDAMFAATDSEWAPWRVVNGDVKKSARLNCITDLLSQIPYEKLPFDAPKLPNHQDCDGYKPAKHDYTFVPEKF